jgi:hypothetical protein
LVGNRYWWQARPGPYSIDRSDFKVRLARDVLRLN